MAFHDTPKSTYIFAEGHGLTIAKALRALPVHAIVLFCPLLNFFCQLWFVVPNKFLKYGLLQDKIDDTGNFSRVVAVGIFLNFNPS